MAEVELSFCVVNTEQRELLVRGLDAIARERAALPFATEVLVLDNASRDGSAGAARRHAAVDDLVVNRRRGGKGENDTALLRRARGRFCLLLNEDSELRPGATAALHSALEARPDAAAAGAALLRRSRGRYCLLLNEDSELRPGAVLALHEALTSRPGAAAAGAR
ncbi:MAG: glycosyltransferase, partial [Actinomycetota bacterium]|nr:glycosyltransferase [Actinomycetota bacterium]